jgi:hypothetical protein
MCAHEKLAVQSRSFAATHFIRSILCSRGSHSLGLSLIRSDFL